MKKSFLKLLFAIVVAALGAIYVGAAFASMTPVH